MNFKSNFCLVVLLLAATGSAGAATLSVTASDTFSGSLYSYTYNFAVTGGNVDNIYLGSGDISPLNVNIFFDNSLTTSWSWLGNDTPQDYLQFFRTGGSLLTPVDTLRVTFSSSFAPSQNSFAIALNSGTGEASATVNNVLAPAGSPTAVPEPSSIALTAVAAGLGGFMLHLRRRIVGRR